MNLINVKNLLVLKRGSKKKEGHLVDTQFHWRRLNKPKYSLKAKEKPN